MPDRLRARRPPVVRALSPLRDFLATESASGVLLAAAAVIALVWANSPWSGSYRDLWATDVSVSLGGHELLLDLRHWVGEGLMTVFFLVVGLEIKRELTTGHLASLRAAALPVVGAVGGMLVPALVYLAIAGADEPRGWAVPIATDIALALGVLAVDGDRLSASTRAFLLGLAIVDDIGAVVVIAVFYSSGVRLAWLAVALVALVVAAAARRSGASSVVPFVAIGVVMWLALHEAGIHPTLAGVALGLLAPSTPRISPELIDVDDLNDLSSVEAARTTTEIARGSVSTVEWLLHRLHGWTGYVVVPLFALANAGIEISSSGVSDALRSPIAWGVVAGLVVGKPVGVVVAARLARRAGLGDEGGGAAGRGLLGVGAAAGIGFTVALFVAELAFDEPSAADEARLAILAGSVVSALVSMAVLSGGSRTAADASGPA